MLLCYWASWKGLYIWVLRLLKVLEPCDVYIHLGDRQSRKGWRQRLFRHLPEGSIQCMRFARRAMSDW